MAAPLASVLPERELLRLQEDPVAFVRAFDREPWPYQSIALRAVTAQKDGRFERRIAVISWPRQQSKSTVSCWLGLWAFYCFGEQEIITAALDRASAGIILNDARRIIQGSDLLYGCLERHGFGRSELRAKGGNVWRIRPAESAYSRGIRPSLVLFDELGHSRDDGALFDVLSSAQAARPNPLLVVTSTVSPIQNGKLWSLFEAARAGDPAIRLLYSNANESPLVTAEFLEGQRRTLPPSAYLREHENRWNSGTDAFADDSDWQRAIADGDPSRAYDDGPTVCFADLGWSHDETAIAIAKREGDKAAVICLEAYKGSKAEPLDLNRVADRMAELAKRYGITQAQVESPQGVAIVQHLQRQGLNVEVVYPTQKGNQERWGCLYNLLKSGGVRLPNDALLRRQLLSLVIKQSLSGWRLEDAPGLHQDRAVAVAGAVSMLGLGYSPVPEGVFAAGVDGLRELSKWESSAVVGGEWTAGDFRGTGSRWKRGTW